jgi:UDP-glucose 4-epimerase
MILIIGGNGYLGKRIASFLNYKSYDLIIGSTQKNISDSDSYETLYCDVLDKNSLFECTKSVDAVINLSGLNSEDSKKFPDLANDVKILGNKNLSEACKLNNVKKIISFSTIHVYKKPLIGEFLENSSAMPSHPYGISNLKGEKSLIDALTNTDIDYTIFRLSNAVGRPLNVQNNCWRLLVNDICRSAVADQSITIKSNKNTLRDFISISDICNYLEFFINNEGDKNFPIFNLCSGNSITIEDIAKKVVLAFSKCNINNIKLEFIDQNEEKLPLKISNSKLIDFTKIESSGLDNEIFDLAKSCVEWFG